MNERTRSVCPVCLRPVEAARIGRKDGIYLHKKCREHGAFMVPIWRGRLDFDSWRKIAAFAMSMSREPAVRFWK